MGEGLLPDPVLYGASDSGVDPPVGHSSTVGSRILPTAQRLFKRLALKGGGTRASTRTPMPALNPTPTPTPISAPHLNSHSRGLSPALPAPSPQDSPLGFFLLRTPCCCRAVLCYGAELWGFAVPLHSSPFPSAAGPVTSPRWEKPLWDISQPQPHTRSPSARPTALPGGNSASGERCSSAP